ncbi:MAG: hypothetical protein Q8P33_03020 [bacterium]|nr:hypothetical protein [bacterium]
MTKMPVTTTTQNNKRSPLHLVAWILVVLMAAVMAYLIWINQQLRSPESQLELAEQATQQTIQQVSEILLVPTDEEPAVATIIDVASLQQENQEFFVNAANGDQLLLYRNSAVIYRPGEHKIINVSPIVISPEDLTSESFDDQATDEELEDVTPDLETAP